MEFTMGEGNTPTSVVISPISDQVVSVSSENDQSVAMRHVAASNIIQYAPLVTPNKQVNKPLSLDCYGLIYSHIKLLVGKNLIYDTYI